MSIGLAYEFSYWAGLKPFADFGPGPLGRRAHFQVIDGAATGERFTARYFGGGGDWVVVSPDGYGHIDVRLQFETGDGARVYVEYGGLLEINETVSQAMASGGATRYEDQYFRTTLRLETGDERYAWMNRTVFVARGHLVEGLKVEYEVYRLV
jgi:hypothetical protein